MVRPMYAGTMPAGALLVFQQEDKPVTTVHVTGSDGLQYEIKLALMVQAVVETGITNPIDDMPLFNIVAQTLLQVKRKTDG
jgi:hypothetical protein